jgi:hypothetical protein
MIGQIGQKGVRREKARYARVPILSVSRYVRLSVLSLGSKAPPP